MKAYILLLGALVAVALFIYVVPEAQHGSGATDREPHGADHPPIPATEAFSVEGSSAEFDVDGAAIGGERLVEQAESHLMASPLPTDGRDNPVPRTSGGPQGSSRADRPAGGAQGISSIALTDPGAGISSSPRSNGAPPSAGQTASDIMVVEVEIAVPDFVDGQPATIPAALAGTDGNDPLPGDIRQGVEEIAARFVDSVERASATDDVEFGNAWRDAQSLSDWEFKAKYGRQLWHAEHIRAYHEAGSQ